MHCTKPHKMTMFFCCSIQFSLLFSKESRNYKAQYSSKMFYISFSFSIKGLVCLQSTSTFSAGNLISIRHCASYIASVNLREVVIERMNRRGTKVRNSDDHTPFTTCALLSLYTKAQLPTGEGRVKTRTFLIDIQHLVQPDSKNTG